NFIRLTEYVKSFVEEASRKIQNAEMCEEEFQEFKLLAEFYREIANEVRRKKPHWLKEEIKMEQETLTSGKQCQPNTPERKKRTRHLAKGRAQTPNNTRSYVKEEKNRLVNKKTNVSKWYLKLAQSDYSPGQRYDKAMCTIRNKKTEHIEVEKGERIRVGRNEKLAWEWYSKSIEDGRQIPLENLDQACED
ncbi:17820_t:CDS:2, partial [Cetraspora pellucida]